MFLGAVLLAQLIAWHLFALSHLLRYSAILQRAVYATRYSSDMTDSRPKPARASLAALGGPARWPVLVVAVVAVTGAYWWTLGNLLPESTGADAPTSPARTTQMADLEAVEAILETVQRAVKSNEFAKAETVLEAAVEQYPRDQALRLALGDLFVRMSQPVPEAEGQDPEPIPDEQRLALERRAYEQFVEALRIGPRMPGTEFAAGSLARSLGNLDSAIAHFESASTLDKANANYPLHLAQVYFSRNELDAANARLAVAVSLDPDLATAWGMMAEIALKQGSPRIALEHLERVTALEPRELAWRHMQARAFSRVGEPDKALAALDALPEAERFSRISLQLAGQALGLARRPEDALARYEQALASGVSDPQVYLDAATWAERLGKVERARELAQTAAMADVPGARRLLDRLEATP
jgi:tetratricopeptide (TPR) repeat protein